MTRLGQDPSEIFSERYVARSLTRKRRHGRTEARISIKRPRLAMLRRVRLRTSKTRAPRSQPDVRWAKASSIASDEKADLPYGTPVTSKPGLVTSPFAPEAGYVQVIGFPPGTAVEDPYARKIFLTPWIGACRVCRSTPRWQKHHHGDDRTDVTMKGSSLGNVSRIVGDDPVTDRGAIANLQKARSPPSF